MKVVAALVALWVVLAACSSPVGPSLVDESTEPQRYTNASPSDEAYGWVSCVGILGDQPRSQSRTAAMFDPTTTSGVRLQESTRDDASTNLRRWDLDEGTVTSSTPYEEDAAVESMALEALHSVAALRALFDFDTVVEDVMDPSNTGPLVRELPTPGGTDIDLRFEGLGEAWPFYWAENDPHNFAAIGAMHPEHSNSSYTYSSTVPWLLDVWADGNVIERVRFQTQSSDQPTVSELRFVDADKVIRGGEVVLPACPQDPTDSSDDWFELVGWSPERATPPKISLDPDGRPYDTELYSDVTIAREVIGELAAPGGELLVMDGNSIQVSPSFFIDGAVPIAVEADRIEDDGRHHINLEIIWEQRQGEDGPWQAVLGVWVGPTNADVVAWDDFELAYGTDGGTGGIIAAQAVHPISDDTDWINEPDFDSDYELLDLDDVPGTETFTFSNGFGDGGFPMSRGRNADGDVVAVVIWRTGLPWRLAIPGGTPPADVTEREENLIECLAGDRAFDATGQCEWDEFD